MKLATFTAVLIGSTSAFVPSSKNQPMVLRESADSVAADVPVVVEPVLPKMSQSLPFLLRPAALTGELAGDVGFDPLGFAKNKEDLVNFREAEIKHSRLAMLAAAGWPVSEVLDKKIAGKYNIVKHFSRVFPLF